MSLQVKFWQSILNLNEAIFLTLKIGEYTTFSLNIFFTFYVVSPLIFKLEKATIYQIKANVMRIQQNLTVFGYLLQNPSYWFGSQSSFFWDTPYERSKERFKKAQKYQVIKYFLIIALRGGKRLKTVVLTQSMLQL